MNDYFLQANSKVQEDEYGQFSRRGKSGIECGVR